MSPTRILVASRRLSQRAELRAALEFEGYEVADVATATEVLEYNCAEHYHALVLDSELDTVGAHSLCHAIRQQSTLGIIVWGENLGTTAIDALNAGADDFILAPFVVGEMLARLRAILRRMSRHNDHHPIVLQDREVDLKSFEIKGPGTQVARLTPKEFLVLQYLIAHANEPRTTQALARTIWHRDGRGELEYVRIVIRQLRKKLEPDPEKPRYIISERSEGYRFQMPSVQARCHRSGVRQWARLA